MFSRKRAVLANENALPANQTKNRAKKPANQKGGCFEYHAVIVDKIEYRYIHRASICPASGIYRRSFFAQNHGQIQEIGGVLFEQACLCRRKAERLPLLRLLDEWQKGLPSG